MGGRRFFHAESGRLLHRVGAKEDVPGFVHGLGVLEPGHVDFFGVVGRGAVQKCFAFVFHARLIRLIQSRTAAGVDAILLIFIEERLGSCGARLDEWRRYAGRVLYARFGGIIVD